MAPVLSIDLLTREGPLIEKDNKEWVLVQKSQRSKKLEVVVWHSIRGVGNRILNDVVFRGDVCDRDGCICGGAETCAL